MFEKLIELLAALPVTAVLRIECERLLQRNLEIEKEVAKLNAVIAEQDKRLAEYAAKEQFVEFRGVLWRKLESGRYATDPVCPVCRVVLWQCEDLLPFRCSICKFKSPFLRGELTAVFERLVHEFEPKN